MRPSSKYGYAKPIVTVVRPSGHVSPRKAHKAAADKARAPVADKARTPVARPEPRSRRKFTKERPQLPSACPICCPVPPIITAANRDAAVIPSGNEPTVTATERKSRRARRKTLDIGSLPPVVQGVSPLKSGSLAKSSPATKADAPQAARGDRVHQPDSETVQAAQGTTPAVCGPTARSESCSDAVADWAAQCDTLAEWQRLAHLQDTQRPIAASPDAENFPPTCTNCRLQFASPSAYREHTQSRRHAVSLLQTQRSSILTRGDLIAHSKPEALANTNRQLQVAIRVLLTRATRHTRKERPWPKF